MADFASMLKYLRERENLSQRELATKLNMSPSAIGMYERGKRHPRPEEEEIIADFFNVDLNTLRGRRIDENINEYDSQTKEFVRLFQNVSEADRDAVMRFLKSLQL